MAVITISNTGGNFNATTSWVGGVVPLTTDSISATGTSGPLTINVASTVVGADFTGYTSTLAINFDFTINAGALILVNTMTITGTAYLIAAGTSTIKTNGLTIPWFRFSGQNTTRTLQDNMTITNLGQSFGNQNPATAGSFTMSVTNFRQINTGGGSYGWLLGTVPIVFNGANCYYENSTSQSGITSAMYINTAGTFTISGTTSNTGQIVLGTFNTSQGGSSQLIYQNGTIAGDKNISIYYGNMNNTLGVKLDVGTASWNSIFIKEGTNITAASTNIINLSAPLIFSNMYLTAASSVAYTTARLPLKFIGTSYLQGGTFSAQSVMMNNYTTNIQSILPAAIQFTPNAGTTHSFTNLNIVGLPNGKSSITSTTATKVGLSFSNVLLYTDLTALQAPTTTYVYGGTLSNTTNFSTIGFGGGESSYTFVN